MTESHPCGVKVWPLETARIRGVTSDRKSTRLNSSHSQISYAVFCLKKKTHIYRSRYAVASLGFRINDTVSRRATLHYIIELRTSSDPSLRAPLAESL